MNSTTLNRIRDWINEPILFIFNLSTKTQLYIVILIFIIFIVVIPFIRWVVNLTYRVTDPIRFNLLHVLVVGGSDGLGKAIVKEVFLKGALVTIVGREQSKMQKISEELDNKKKGKPLIKYFDCDILNMDG